MSDQQRPSTADRVAEKIRKAADEGMSKARPAWESKGAPRVASGAARAARWSESVRERADQRAVEYSSEDRPSSKILGGALGVGAALALLGAEASRWVGKKSEESVSRPAASPDAGAEAASEPIPGPEPGPASAAPTDPVTDPVTRPGEPL
ncbi:hypothetical protein DNL40_03865 [Xylanimonas oleitrophica]|uniref:DUF3618 domain-containing protein n=1 Tax=Xylanimonas oleitrophica TaxID=2607479 RepID=A0A2W5WRW4_9MICO|nr:hypothetical protein [Xylanimonas oleitrophica]PZR54087.1 hypothetical protein DNL40_03865 [Xylanimonas oleitrophica]